MGIRHLNADASIEEVLEIIDQDAGVIIDLSLIHISEPTRR